MNPPTSTRIKTFRILIQAAREIRGNQIKTKTEYEILRNSFDPQIYAAKSYVHAKKQIFHPASTLFRDADSERRILNCEKFKSFLDKNHWPRQLPFGFSRGEQGKIIMDDEAKAVYIIFDIFLKTKSITKTQKSLGEFGHTLSESKIVRILQNSVYHGIVKVNGLDLKCDHILHPIVTQEIFDAAQSIFTQRNRRSKPVESVSSFFPLNGFVTDYFSKVNYCGYLIRKKKKNIHYYKIQFAARPINLRAGEFHELFERHLSISYLNSNEILSTFFAEMYDIIETHVLKFLEELEDEYLKICKVIGSTDLANEPELLMEYQVRARKIESQLKDVDFFSDETTFSQFGIEMFSGISKIWKEGDYESKKNLQLLAFPKGVFFDDRSCTFINKRLIFESSDSLNKYNVSTPVEAALL